MVISLVMMQINLHLNSPLLAIFHRWLRWFVFAFGTAQFSIEFDWIDRPFWVLVIVFFIIWFLGETLINWVAISAHSLSSIPLFPRYTINNSGEEWPVQPRLLKVREWLRSQGFRQIQALKAEIAPAVFLRVSIYEDTQATVRVQITFIPQANGAISICFGVMSCLSDGRRIVTDNLYLPFAGFYPENWLVERDPCCRSLSRLQERHRRRLLKTQNPVQAFSVDPLTDLNAIQRELDQLNTELGFLHPHQQREDLGKFTQEGRYRVWKEIWTLNYLGRAASYE
jgi:hypothetical protein